MHLQTMNLLIALILACVATGSLDDEPHHPLNKEESTPPYLTLNISSTANINILTLAQNVEKLLLLSRHSPKIQISHATLVKVVLTGNPYRIDTETTNYHDLRRLQVVFHGFRPRPQLGEGNSVLFVNDPHRWDSWLPPHWFDVAMPNFQRQNELRWEETQALMDIDRASYLRREAGYTDPYDRIEISQWGSKPLSYCFTSLRRPKLVRVAIPTGKVSEDFICSS